MSKFGTFKFGEEIFRVTNISCSLIGEGTLLTNAQCDLL